MASLSPDNSDNDNTNIENEEGVNISNEEELNNSNSNSFGLSNFEIEEENVGEDDEVDEEPDVEGSIESAVQVAPTENLNPSLQDADDPMLMIQLGDRVVVDSNRYKRTVGIVYYNDADRMSVKPDGVENMVQDFEMDENGFLEEYGVRDVYVIEKRKYESFVEQQDLRVNQLVDTFDADGIVYGQFRIIRVNEEEDSVVLQNMETEEEQELVFGFIGIPSDEPFKVLSVSQYVPEEKENMEGAEVEAEEKEGEPLAEVPEEEEGEEEGEEAEEGEAEEDEIEEIGFVEITRPQVIREAVSSEQRFDDNVQKVDALNDFLTSLDPSLQKDPKAIRAVRILVETLFNLKQMTIAYNEDRTVRGLQSVSATYLADLVKQVPVPLSRPVLRIIKKEYDVEVENLEENKEGDTEIDFVDFENELRNMIQKEKDIVSSQVKGAQGGQVVEFWQNMRGFLREYVSPWRPNGDSEPLWKALQDSELFRMYAPDIEESEDGTRTMANTVPGYLASHSQKGLPVFDRIPYGIERALAVTYRKGAERKKQLFLSEDAATINNYLLFPMKVANQMGTTRSGSLAIDSGRSQLTRKTMKGLLYELGAPKDVGTSNDIILLGKEGSTFGNIPLADYIEGFSVPALGLGDVFQTLDQYGMENLELTPDIVNVLVKKMELYQSQLVSTIAELRRMLDKEEAKEPEANSFLENPTILDIITNQPLLVDDLKAFKRINPILANSDLAQVAYLLQKHPDYFQVAAGKNPILIAKALLTANRQLYVETLKVATLLRFNEQNAGDKPKANPCKHVKDLVAVRRIHDDTERMEKLTEFFRHYQSGRTENWINCSLCKEHLLCVHELLQIRAYLTPREKPTIEKEIILKFSGGQFQGNYICRNCGQPFRMLDFDNNIEFDDDGKPKSGRAVLVDEDALFQEKLQLLVSAPAEPSEQQELELSADEKDIYDIVRELSGRVGIDISKDGYKFITTNAVIYKGTLFSEAKYNKYLAKNPNLAPYEEYRASRLIPMIAAYLLVEIQTHMPPYVIRRTLMGCTSPGFDGYPLDNDTNNKQGIEYIACAVSSIRRKDGMWPYTGYQDIPNDVERQKHIIAYIDRALTEVMKNVNIVTKLDRARAYLTDVLGAESQKGRPRDVIPATFLPQQIIVSREEAAKDAIQPEVAAAMGNKGAKALVTLWIRQAHAIAKSTASLIRGSPLSDTTCCLTSVNEPGNFWYHQAELPPIGRRVLTPYSQGSPLLTHFVPRPASSIVAEPNKDLYYLLFLKCCFTGPRKGHLHEPGLDNLCAWCGFQFPNMPKVMDADTEGKGALASQNVVTDSKEFTNLLDAIHTVNRVEPLPPKPVITDRDVMIDFGDIDPSPIVAWNGILLETYQNFLRLPSDEDEGAIAVAAGPISNAARVARDSVRARFKDQKYITIMDRIVRLPWANFFQVILSYFLTPFERKTVNYKPKSMIIPYELEQTLVEDHIKNIQKIITADVEVVTFKQDELHTKEYTIALKKMEYYVQQLRAILPFKSMIGPKTIPHGKSALSYIQEILFYGPLALLLDTRQLPPGVEARPLKDSSKTLLLQYVGGTLLKYNNEYLTYDDKEIKEKIEIRNEKERTMVLQRFNKLSEEERKVELIAKNLRIGKWSIGGKIHAYDGEVMEIERIQRAEMGLDEFPVSAFGDLLAPEGQKMDEYGNILYSDEQLEREGGYDHRQRPDEDDE